VAKVLPGLREKWGSCGTTGAHSLESTGTHLLTCWRGSIRFTPLADADVRLADGKATLVTEYKEQPLTASPEASVSPERQASLSLSISFPLAVSFTGNITATSQPRN